MQLQPFSMIEATEKALDGRQLFKCAARFAEKQRTFLHYRPLPRNKIVDEVTGFVRAGSSRSHIVAPSLPTIAFKPARRVSASKSSSPPPINSANRRKN